MELKIQDPDPPWWRGVFRASELNGSWRAFVRQSANVHQFARGLFGGGRGPSSDTIAVLYRCSHAIASLETSLWMHHLLEQEPKPIWITIGARARKPQLAPLKLETFRWITAPDPDDISWTPYIVGKRRLPAFNLIKTAVDFIRVRNRIGLDRAHKMLELLVPNYVTVDEFLACAQRCGVSYPAERYLRRTRNNLLPGGKIQTVKPR